MARGAESREPFPSRSHGHGASPQPRFPSSDRPVRLLGACPKALGLATERFGNDPLGEDFGLDRSALALANLKARIYYYEVNANPTFYYRGDTDAFNEALKLFANVVGDAREVVFLPGPGEGHNLTGERHFAYDWWFNSPTGLHRGGVPTLTVYVSGVAPATPPDAKQLTQWISDLDSETFATRDLPMRLPPRSANASKSCSANWPASICSTSRCRRASRCWRRRTC
jgi:hypothetical protein